MKTATASLLLLLGSAVSTAQQPPCATVGSPCGIPSIACQGTPEIGETFAIVAPGVPGQPMILALGPILAVNPPLVPAPTACIPPGCTVHVDPFVLLKKTVGEQAQAAFSFDVPDDPSLVGAVVGAQAWTVSPGQPCLYASGGLRVTIG